MVKPIVMPKYGLQQDEGTVIRWLKQEGERVTRGEALLELETDKAVFEYESPEEGVLRKVVAGDGVRVLADLKVGGDGRFSLSNPRIVNPLEAPLPGALYGTVSQQENGLYALEAPGLKATFDPKASTMEGTLALGDKTLSFKGRVTGERTMEAVREDGTRVTFNVEVGKDGRFVFYNPRVSGPAPLDLKA